MTTPTDEQIEALRQSIGGQPPANDAEYRTLSATLDSLLAERKANARIVLAAKRWAEQVDAVKKRNPRHVVSPEAKERYDAVKAAGEKKP